MVTIDSIPERRKFIIKENYENVSYLIIHDHHLIKDSRVITLTSQTAIFGIFDSARTDSIF